jgi:putative endonuclease
MLALPLLEGFVRISEALRLQLGKPRQAAHLELGRRGEDAAFFHLRRHGYIVVARDWRSGKAPGDLDLIAWDGPALCFLEVKTRSSRNVAPAEFAVDHDKKRLLRRLARQYLLALPEEPEQIRFDVLSIYFEARKPVSFELFRGAFGWH